MRDYGKVFSSIWESEDFRSLTEDGRTLVLYLLTCKHATIAGVFRLPDGYACEDLQWTAQRVSQGFSELFAKGFAARCEGSMWVWITKFMEWNPPENPNQRKAAAKIAATVPDRCVWKQAFMQACAHLMGLEQPVDNKPLPKGSATVGEPVSVAVAGTGEGTGTGLGGPDDPPPPPPPPAPPPPPPAADAPDKRGTRLPKDWLLPKSWGEWAIEKYPHWTPEKVRDEAAQFRNHWTSKTGKDATKLDWYATWQNWCMSPMAHRDAGGGKPVNRQAALEASNRAVAERWANQQGEPPSET